MNEIFTLERGSVSPAQYTAPTAHYQAPLEWRIGVPVPVATFPATSPEGGHTVLFETRLPDVLFSAFMMDHAGVVRLVLDCPAAGSKPVLLGDLCECFAQGRALLDLPPGIGRMAKQQSLIAVPTSEGQDVDVFRTVAEPNWTLVAARPRALMFGAGMREPANVYLADTVVAERLARAMNQGSIRARQLAGEYLA